jgi:hypothetical protein
MRMCLWRLTDGIWYTGCGDAWSDARHAAWRHCPLCGLKLVPPEPPKTGSDDCTCLGMERGGKTANLPHDKGCPCYVPNRGPNNG